MLKIFITFLILFYVSLSQAGEIISNSLGEGDSKIDYTYTYSESTEAYIEKSTLEKISQAQISFEMNFEGKPLEVKMYKFSKKNFENQKNLLTKAKSFFTKEHNIHSTEVKFLRHASFVLTSGVSIYLWTTNSSIMTHQAFMGASISVFINTLFIYMEDFFDYRVYRNKYSARVGKKIVTPFLNFGARAIPAIHRSYEKLLSSLGRSISNTKNIFGQEILDKESKELSYAMTGKYIEETGFKLERFLNKHNNKIHKNVESFMARFLSSLGINFMLAVSYKAILLGIPTDIHSFSEFSMEVGVALAAVTFIGQSYSLVRGALKDLLREGMISRRFTQYYAAFSRVALAGVMTLLYLKVYSLETLALTVGLPGWTMAILLVSGQHKSFLSKRRKEKARNNAAKYGKIFMSGDELKAPKTIWDMSNYRDLGVRYRSCKTGFTAKP